MPAELRRSPQAREDLPDIYVTIGLDNPAPAERIFTTIEMKTGLLPLHPRLGVRHPQIAPSVPILVEGPYLILYKTPPNTDDGPIKVVKLARIVDGRRDLNFL